MSSMSLPTQNIPELQEGGTHRGVNNQYNTFQALQSVPCATNGIDQTGSVIDIANRAASQSDTTIDAPDFTW